MNIQTCPHCYGHGRLPRYAIDGDFLGEKECDECRGSGLVIARDLRGRFTKADSNMTVSRPPHPMQEDAS